jgi:hypothetical protein
VPRGVFRKRNFSQETKAIFENGTIIAIYDVKTGQSGLTAARIAGLLAKTRAPDGTRVIELRIDGPIVKIQLAHGLV